MQFLHVVAKPSSLNQAASAILTPAHNKDLVINFLVPHFISLSKECKPEESKAASLGTEKKSEQASQVEPSIATADTRNPIESYPYFVLHL
jgi:hypothetical protein